MFLLIGKKVKKKDLVVMLKVKHQNEKVVKTIVKNIEDKDDKYLYT